MQITMNNGYDKNCEAMFGDLVQEIFDFSFAPWFERKLWNDRYESYSIIENKRMPANICIYKTEMNVSGSPFNSLQFGGVATRKDERGKGLSRLLMEHILAKYPGIPAFLGANPSVTEFYPRFGFRPVQTYRPFIETAIENGNCESIKLCPDDAALINAIHSRKMYSHAMDSLNTQSIQIFHLLLDYPDAIYKLPGCGAVVIAEQKEDELFIADVIAQAPVRFDAIQKELPFKAVRIVEFGFNPDWKPVDMRREPYFIRGEWNLPTKFRFPIMSEI